MITWFENWTWILKHSKGLLRINTCYNNCSTLLWNASEWKKYILHIHDIEMADRFAKTAILANQCLGTNLKSSSRHFSNQNIIVRIPLLLSGFQTLRCYFISFQIQPLFEGPFETLSFRPTRLDPIHRHLNQSACYRSH